VPRLIATYCVFNNQDLIYESLTSVVNLVDEIRLYDGRFLDYKCHCGSDHDNSCDRTMDEIDQFGRDNPGHAPIKVNYLPPMLESEKRTKMMSDVPEGDMVFVIDDDELFFGDPRPVREFAEKPTAKFAYMDFLFAGNGHGTGVTIPLARLFVRTPGLGYEQYYRLHDRDGLVVDMKADNLRVPYGRRQPQRTYIHPSARICELWLGYRDKKRDAARTAYNNLIANRGWK